MTDLKTRERKVDLEKMEISDVERISAELGEKMGKVLAKAEEEVNKLCSIYGVRVQVAVKITNSLTGKETDPVTFKKE
jgi:hypothetical protein